MQLLSSLQSDSPAYWCHKATPQRTHTPHSPLPIQQPPLELCKYTQILTTYLPSRESLHAFILQQKSSATDGSAGFQGLFDHGCWGKEEGYSLLDLYRTSSPDKRLHLLFKMTCAWYQSEKWHNLLTAEPWGGCISVVWGFLQWTNMFIFRA